ncbi:MAG: hypothetical protein J0L94_14935 [Rhodothermia bacterium]|nr:hypothetical protein [Rhodothermia bacterium]
MKTLSLLFISGYFILSGCSDSQYKAENIQNKKRFHNSDSVDISSYISSYKSRTILFVINPPVCSYCMNDIYTWKRLIDSQEFQDRIDIKGLVLYQDKEYAEKFIRLIKLDIPFLFVLREKKEKNIPINVPKYITGKDKVLIIDNRNDKLLFSEDLLARPISDQEKKLVLRKFLM